MDPNLTLCNADSSVLLVIDIQLALTSAMSDEEGEQMLTNTGALLEAATALSIPVRVTEQYPAGLGLTNGSVEEKLPPSAIKYEKTCFSACTADGFGEELKSIQRPQVILAGQEAHVCVLQTAMQLVAQEYQVFVVEDAICSRKQTHKFFALERMRDAGIIITNHESVLFEWLGDASHPQFKQLAQLVR